MALNINGTTGISGVDGSASAASIAGTDSNTGLSFASDTVNINTGGVTRATVDSSGALDVPTDFPIKVNGTEKARIKSDGRISIGDSTTPMTAAAITSNYLQATTGQAMVGIVSNQTSHPDDTSNIAAQARSVSGGVTRQCYIGTRKVSTNNPAGFLYIQQRDGGNSHIWADNSAKIRTSNDADQVGGTGGTVVGTQTSDIRLKNNLGSVSYGLTEINKITPIKYTFKKDESSRQQIGFSAQDIQSIIPESVYDTEQTIEVEGTEVKNTLAMEYVALIPVLVNAVKELSAKVETLETKVATLEAG